VIVEVLLLETLDDVSDVDGLREGTLMRLDEGMVDVDIPEPLLGMTVDGLEALLGAVVDGGPLGCGAV
jgi:hypothetical protein